VEADRFDVAATRDAIGLSAVWRTLRDGAGLDKLDGQTRNRQLHSVTRYVLRY
jgi:hypothetical protein